MRTESTSSSRSSHVVPSSKTKPGAGGKIGVGSKNVLGSGAETTTRFFLVKCNLSVLNFE